MAERVQPGHAAREGGVAKWCREGFVTVVRRGITETFGKWIGLDLQFCYQLVLISSNRSKLSFRKDESSVFFLLDISYGSHLAFLPFYQIDPGLKLVHRIQDHLPGVIRLVVCDLDFFKTDDLFLELLPGVGSIRMTVKTMRRGRIRLPCHQPRGAVVGIPVPLVVTRHDVQEDEVLDSGLGVKI